MEDKPRIASGCHLAAEKFKPLRDRLRKRFYTAEAKPVPVRQFIDWQIALQKWLSDLEENYTQLENAFITFGALAAQENGGRPDDVIAAVRNIGNAAGKLLAVHGEIVSARFIPPYNEGRILLAAAVERGLKTLLDGLDKYAHAVAHPERLETGRRVNIDIRLNNGPELQAFNQWVAKLRKQEEQRTSLVLADSNRRMARAGRRGFWSTLLLGGLLNSMFADRDCDDS